MTQKSSLSYLELLSLLVETLNSNVPVWIYDEVVELDNNSLCCSPKYLDNSNSKLAFNTLLTQVKFPKNFNADLGLGLRSVKGTKAAEGYNADALNTFGFSVGVSKKIEKLQKPVIYGQFVWNMDPYKGFGDGQEQFDLDGYVLGGGVEDFDGEAACRVGIRWDI